jgi:hypothetical protein
MSVASYEREVRRARAAYVGALRRLAAAMTSFNAAAVPLDPEPGGQIPPWSAEEAEVMERCATAWQHIVAWRREYDSAVRALNETGERPYA